MRGINKYTTKSLIAAASLVVCMCAFAADKQNISIVFIKQMPETLPKLSNLYIPPKDDGVNGAEQGIMDNNTTGEFLNQHYALESFVVEEDAIPETFEKAFAQGSRQFVMDMSAQNLLAIADSPTGKQAWFYNVGAEDNDLRTQQCRANIVHLAPSYAMRAEALAQYLVAKKWTQWFLVQGRRDADRAFADAIERAAKKFGAKIVEKKNWDYASDMRRLAAATVPTFTQNIDYDVLVVSDIIGEFGEYLMYRTWDPRPVVGTQGLKPVTWHRSHERWGAAQIQSRFLKNFNYSMSEKEYGAWSAIRTIGEAATRLRSDDHQAIAGYIRGPEFALAGYKGQKMSFRTWNSQLRQPIILVTDTSLVSVSPQPQFLHEKTALDTLGYDVSSKENQCFLNKK